MGNNMHIKEKDPLMRQLLRVGVIGMTMVILGFLGLIILNHNQFLSPLLGWGIVTLFILGIVVVVGGIFIILVLMVKRDGWVNFDNIYYHDE
jgi:hypothetical protein